MCVCWFEKNFCWKFGVIFKDAAIQKINGMQIVSNANFNVGIDGIEVLNKSV